MSPHLTRTGSTQAPSDESPNTLSDEALRAHWMPFTWNRGFRKDPRILVSAEGCHYRDADNRRIFDGLSGMWTCGLGHALPEIVSAIQKQAARLDYAPPFNHGHPAAFRLAERVQQVMPEGLDHVFFVGSGSEAVDTALKLARAYWRLRKQGHKTRFIGRAKGYHGVNFGGISVGGMVGNRRFFGQGVEADHLSHTQLPENAFSRGLPAQGADLADQLIELIALHDASTVAAVIVEPFSGSGGVVVPPQGYLQRLRQICDRHDILLIFDEVISAFGRSGAWTASSALGVVPDMITFAKQVTNGAIPLGGVVASRSIYEVFMAQEGAEYLPEFPHGYTYSAHPVACAAGLATLDLLEREDAAQRVLALAPHFEAAVHSLRGSPHVVDIRNIGLAAGLSLAHAPGEPARRPFEVAQRCWQKGFYVRSGADTLQLAPPFVATRSQIDALVNAVGEALREVH